MFKKTSKSPQLNLFTSSQSFFTGKSLSLYEDKASWHNQFRQQVTMRIDEEIFRPLYCQDNGTPNAPVRILVAMMILKEAERLSDEKLFENCRFNLLTRGALGLLNADDQVPTESTYYLFRKRIYDYAKQGNDNLFDVMFAQITKSQCIEFEVSGKQIRMDSKLLGSNIKWLSRYELVHETFRLFYKKINQYSVLDTGFKEKLDSLLNIEGNKVVYTCTNEEVKTRLQELGELIYRILPLFSTTQLLQYQNLKRVFDEQFKLSDNKLPVARDKEEISAKSVQSPHDTDCHYRNKDGNKVKGYSINVTESCDDDKDLNLVGRVNVQKASTSDVDFFQEDIEKTQEVFPDKIEDVHTDGAYHSPGNHSFCTEKDIRFYLHAIQGAKGRYRFSLSDSGELSVFDTEKEEPVSATKVTCKNGELKWRIKTQKGYRYFTQNEIDNCLIRNKIDETPIETLQKRNNVEATIFQLGYHYSNAKSRYRGHIKHQMWANIRCLWVNFVRILKHIRKSYIDTPIFAKYALQLFVFMFNIVPKLFFIKLSLNNGQESKNIRFSCA